MRIAAYSVIALVMVGVLVVPSEASWWWDSSSSAPHEARSYSHESDFNARGKHDASQRGPGGWAAEVISNAREGWQGGLSGRGAEDVQADQEANNWGRSGNDRNRYRPASLPEEY